MEELGAYETTEEKKEVRKGPEQKLSTMMQVRLS